MAMQVVAVDACTELADALNGAVQKGSFTTCDPEDVRPEKACLITSTDGMVDAQLEEEAPRACLITCSEQMAQLEVGVRELTSEMPGGAADRHIEPEDVLL